MERKLKNPPQKGEKKNKIKLLSFNKKIYSEQAVQKAIKDYADLADFSFAQNKKYFLVKAKNIRPEIKNVFPDEFSNYILSLMKK